MKVDNCDYQTARSTLGLNNRVRNLDAEIEKFMNSIYKEKIESKPPDTIKLPDYWKGLVHEDSITVHLTPIATNQILVVKSVSLEEVTIQNKSKTAKSINCYYHIQGERKDISKLEVEY
jgi:hypothetical protein